MKPVKSSKPSPKAPKPSQRARPAAPPASTPSERTDSRRQRRPRPTPAWLLEQRDLDDVARRRCLLMLSVLSGETPVTDAIEGTDLSRQAYYYLEERALKAMLRALTPGSESAVPTGSDLSALKRVAELEAKVKQLEQDKRRLDRLLLLTRKAVRPGPLKTGHRARSPKTPLPLEIDGLAPLPCLPSTTPDRAPTASTPMPDGAAGC
jgi:hypothetical protein